MPKGYWKAAGQFLKGIGKPLRTYRLITIHIANFGVWVQPKEYLMSLSEKAAGRLYKRKQYKNCNGYSLTKGQRRGGDLCNFR
jgi:hypothetical protein